jgi:ribosomal protein L37AE/L43A
VNILHATVRNPECQHCKKPEVNRKWTGIEPEVNRKWTGSEQLLSRFLFVVSIAI